MLKKVLIVEDNVLIAYLHTRFVERLGGTVVGTTCNFDEFLSIVKEHEPDIILMDILLGQEMDGIDFVMGLPPGTRSKVVYVSASTDPVTMKKAQNSVYHSFLVKPLAMDSLKDLFTEP